MEKSISDSLDLNVSLYNRGLIKVTKIFSKTLRYCAFRKVSKGSVFKA